MIIELFAGAERDASDAAAYYEAQRRGLGAEFLTEFERAVRTLLWRASYGSKVDGTHRRVSFKRFPYVLIYRIDVNAVRVVAVAHRRRSPAYWYPRVQEHGADYVTGS